MSRWLFPLVLVACTGGSGELPNGGSTSSSSGSGSSTSSSGSPSGPTAISAAEFDQSCTGASDCSAVREGDVCGCSCPSAAINKDQLTAYNTKRNELVENCPKTGMACGVDCAASAVVCKSSKCTVSTDAVIFDAGTD